MADTNFIDHQTPIVTPWLQDVNNLVYRNLPSTTNGLGVDLVGGATKKVSSIAALRALRVPQGSDAQTVIVDGYSAAGDGGGGEFIWSSTATNADNGGTVVAPNGSPAQGRWLRIYNGAVNLLWFGAKTDGSDCTQAMQNAIAASFDIYIPAGVYQFASTLNIKRPVNVTGVSGMATAAGLGQQTRLNFARGCSGIIFHRSDTTADATGNCSKVTATTGADGSILRNITVSSGNYAATTGNKGNHGIWLKARARLENVQVYSFEGDGVHIFASTGSSDPNQYGNANNWRLDNVLAYYNAGTGVFVYGTDVNAGQANTVDCSSNSGWGFYDSSFLGNTYVACHTASNTLGGYKTDNNNARNVFIGCYSEGGQAANSMVWPTLILGGMLDNTGFDANSTAVDVTGGSSGLGSNKPVVSSAVANSIQTTTGISSGAGAGLQNGTVLYFQRTGVASQFYWSWDTRYNSTGDLRFSYGPNLSYIQILGPGNTGFKCGKSVAQLYLPIYRYFWLGGTQDSQDDARQITMGAAAPTTGEWAQGDRILNRTPAAGGYEGWICTTAGRLGDPAWVASTAYAVNAYVQNGGNVYQCTTAGTSASSGGPTGTGSSITDGTAIWKYVVPLAVFKTYGAISP